jgi:hypothetical protein
MMTNRDFRLGYRLLAGCLFLGIVVATTPGHAIINERYTPADLVRDAAQIVLLSVNAPAGKQIEAEVLETLQGEAVKEKNLVFSYEDAEEMPEHVLNACFGGAQKATAVLLLSKGERQEGEPSGAIQIGTLWLAVYGQKSPFRVDADKQDLTAVWAGSAKMLAEATRYVRSDPAAVFPTRSDITWEADLQLGKLSAAPNGCLVVDFGALNGICVVVLSEGGDRVYQAGAKGESPTDITANTKFPTASKLAAVGDFNGDGRLDLASWDGKGLKLAIQAADGTFALRSTTVSLVGALSLETVDAGGKGGAGLLVGTARAPLLLVPDGQGGFTTQPLPEPADPAALQELGPGGLCVTADFDRDGLCDVMRLFTKGALLYAGEAPGRFKPPVKTPLPLVKNPCVALCGDYDADGHLDLIVGGEDGLALLSHTENRRLENNTFVSGELDYHGNMNRPQVVGGAPCDINNDGRQGVVLFYPKRTPLTFFNRGFACFGLARQLELGGAGAAATDPLELPTDEPKERLKGMDAMQQTIAGTMWDLNGDGAQDLLGINADNEVWVLFGGAANRRPLGLTIALSPKALGPITVAVSDQKRRIGMHVVRPGMPAYVGRQNPGPLNLEWLGSDGKPQSRRVVVLNPMRVELEP